MQEAQHTLELNLCECMPEKVLVVPCMTSGQCCVFNAPQALALEIKKSLPWADGHQLHFMMHLSFCGWGVSISAGSREMSQNTWFFKCGQGNRQGEKDSQAEKQPLHKDVKEYSLYSEGVTPHWLTHFTLRTHKCCFYPPASVSRWKWLSYGALREVVMHTSYTRNRERSYVVWLKRVEKKPPSVTSLSRGGVSPTLRALAFAARDHQWAVTSAVYPNTHLMPYEGNGQICVRRRFLVGWDFLFLDGVLNNSSFF